MVTHQLLLLPLQLLLTSVVLVFVYAGLANPGPIVSSFYMDQDLPDRVRLDGIVTLVSVLECPGDGGLLRRSVRGGSEGPKCCLGGGGKLQFLHGPGPPGQGTTGWHCNSGE